MQNFGGTKITEQKNAAQHTKLGGTKQKKLSKSCC